MKANRKEHITLILLQYKLYGIFHLSITNQKTNRVKLQQHRRPVLAAIPFTLYAFSSLTIMVEKKTLSPVALIGVWTVSMLLLFPILLIIGPATSVLSILVYMPAIIVTGAAILALSIPLLFKRWYQKNKWTSILLIAGTVVPSVYFWVC